MLKRLHHKLTFFCTLVTGLILIAMSCICLYIAENGLIKSNYSSFLNDLNSMISYLETQSTISNQWISKMENSKYIISISDNGIDLLFNDLKVEPQRQSVIEQAKALALNDYQFDLDNPVNNTLITQHVEFDMKALDGTEYYVSTLTFPKKYGNLSVVVLCSLASQETQILIQRLIFAGVDISALLLLGIFSWIFTKHQIRPVEESRKKQVEFIAAASHELRSPLAVILSNVSALKKSNMEEREQFQDSIESEGLRMSRLVDDMLSLANADNQSWSIHPTLLEPETLVLDVYENFERIAHKKGISLTVNLPDIPMSKINADKERMIQVLTILLDNALYHTPQGGRITLTAVQSYRQIEIHVSDTGPGIPDPLKEKIFERFYRQDTSRTDREHFGLGLCIAREITSLHHGRLTVMDNPFGGADFILSLPTK